MVGNLRQWPANRSSRSGCQARAKVGGPDRDRTGDLVNAIHARSQLRYWPILGGKLTRDRTARPSRSQPAFARQRQGEVRAGLGLTWAVRTGEYNWPGAGARGSASLRA